MNDQSAGFLQIWGDATNDHTLKQSMLLHIFLGLKDIAILQEKIDAGLFGQMSVQLNVEKDVKFVGVSNDHLSKFLILNRLKQGTVEKVLGKYFGQFLDRWEERLSFQWMAIQIQKGVELLLESTELF
jgi:hypothetical protein